VRNEAANAQLVPVPDGTAALSAADARKAIDDKTAARKDVDAQIAMLPDKLDSDKVTRTAVMNSCDALFDTLILPKAHYDDLNARLPDNTATLEELVSKRATTASDLSRPGSSTCR